MARSVAQGFDEFLSRLTPLQSQRDAAAAHRNSVERSVRNAVSVSAFWETGSFHHGTGVRAHSDVDTLVSISNTKPGSSDTALQWIKDGLKASFPNTDVHISRPAVVVGFNSGAETWEVIPGFLRTTTNDYFVYDIPGPASGWIDTGPHAHLDYVNDCNNTKETAGGAKKLARLAKAWKYYRDVPISSFYLEMRAAKYMSLQSSFVACADVCHLFEALEGHALAAMNDPKGVSGRIHPCSSDHKREIALSRLRTAAARARKAWDADIAGKPDDAFSYLDLLFGGRFPSR